MINFFKNWIVKLFYNDFLKSMARPILNNFPALKLKLTNIRDSIYVVSEDTNSANYDTDFLNEIKKEVELRKRANTGNQK